jgi:hypothetical protein
MAGLRAAVSAFELKFTFGTWLEAAMELLIIRQNALISYAPS